MPGNMPQRYQDQVPQPLRTLAEISADILAVENEADRLLDGLLVEATQP